MSQNFWDAFWANLFASLAVVAILTVAGFIAKHRVSRNIRKFIADEVATILKQINNTGQK
ncbi:MAG: hypothetical protein P4L74_05180 [Candidatus Doudnabacteria bacterium]|nr:hypothetical protein [Candidatus Doudnabacteria bacterium]